ncbi:MAG: hypothetical protein EA355_06205 [Rhodobacteraceae bacterium]|nr:MAG: hypothetical protein EA355_06205 [Paracoccaceae bacterium]
MQGWTYVGSGPPFWYWVAAAVFWWRACATTLDVPNALLLAAGRSAEDAALFDALARRQAARAAAGWRRRGATLVAVGAFAIAFAVVAALTRRDGVAAAAVCLFGPAALHAAWARRTAEAVVADPPDAEGLRVRFLRLRAGAFLAAMVNAAAATLLGRFGLP